ncbi:MAG: hypothetical protein DSY81_01900 [Bacillota bacterium]|nr:MAG: hypothetical protein DSY92_07060 [Planctomycetota bacterium]RUA11003.1 MAG: hypothetical protein DSY81_01900 [Bacillota bacterium]
MISHQDAGTEKSSQRSGYVAASRWPPRFRVETGGDQQRRKSSGSQHPRRLPGAWIPAEGVARCQAGIGESDRRVDPGGRLDLAIEPDPGTETKAKGVAKVSPTAAEIDGGAARKQHSRADRNPPESLSHHHSHR